MRLLLTDKPSRTRRSYDAFLLPSLPTHESTWPTGLTTRTLRDLLYLDLALENVVRGAAERGSGAAGASASALVGPLLQNLVLSTGDNEELCYCLKAWQALPSSLRRGGYPSKEDALKVTTSVCHVCSRAPSLSAPCVTWVTSTREYGCDSVP